MVDERLTNLPENVERAILEAIPNCFNSATSSVLGAIMNGELPTQGARDYADIQCANSVIDQTMRDLGGLSPNSLPAGERSALIGAGRDEGRG